MKKLFITLLFLPYLSTYSQNKQELQLQKDSLIILKQKIKEQLSIVNLKIEAIESQIDVINKKAKAIKTIVNSNTFLFQKPSPRSKQLHQLKRKDIIYVLKYYDYGDYYQVISKNEIGYIKENKLKVNNNVRALKNKILQKRKPKKTKRYSTSRNYIRGPRGGCYYINSNGNKTYVSRSLCN